jgi:hypothetical protein
MEKTRVFREAVHDPESEEQGAAAQVDEKDEDERQGNEQKRVLAGRVSRIFTFRRGFRQCFGIQARALRDVKAFKAFRFLNR